jgi:signal transduction histidine kinase/FixJ family two-component response regulator
MIHLKRINLDAFLAVFAVLISAIMLSGVISYSNMVRKSKPFGNELSPQQQLIILGNLVGELQNAENSIRGYRLSRDPGWLQSFYDHSTECDHKLSDLRTLHHSNPDKQHQINLLSGLIEQKLETLEAYSQLTDRTSIVSELEGISRHLDIEPETTKEQEKRQGFIRNLFSRERVEDRKQDSLQIRVLAEVDQIRRKQSLTLLNIDALELEYIVKISEIQNNIEGEVSAMRIDALREVEDMAVEKERRQLHANHMIRLFSITAVIFLFIGGLSIFRYIRKRKQFEMALNQAKVNAEMYSSMQQRFVANMSHEVRTPLHAIAGFTEQLANIRLDKEQQQYILLAQSAIQHLKQVVDDILDYSKLKAGKLKLKLEPFYPKKELDSVTAIFQMELKLKGLYLITDNQLQSNNALMGDALRFRQILINLIGNAIKFTKEGGVQVKLYTEQLLDQRQMLFIEVNDTGIGMDKKQIENIFVPFEQANNLTEGEIHGTGLGLTITRDIIEHQGGKISVESEPGVGTKVTVYIPYLEAEPYVAFSIEQDKKPGYSLSGKKILIADDEEWNRRLTEAMLSKYKARIITVEDGNQAVEKLQSESFDLVLLDLRMPGKNGFVVASYIRHAIQSSVPIIALTAHTGNDFNTDLRSAGITDKLIKPFSEKELLEMIYKVMIINHSSNINEIETVKTNSPSEPLISLSHIDGDGIFNKSKISQLGGNDHKFIKEMIVLFVDNALNSLSSIEEALVINETEQIAWYTHKLAPPARQIGANKMLSLLKKLDEAVNGKQHPKELMEIFYALKTETTQLITALKENYLTNL